MISIGQEYKERYEDAERKLAALREELAEIKESLAYRGSLLNRTQQRAEVAEQRLADAERRNAELEADKSRLDFWQSNPDYCGGFAPSGDWSFFSRSSKTCYAKDLRGALDQLKVMHEDLNPNPEAASHDE